MHGRTQVDPTVEREKRILAETERYRRQTVFGEVVSRSIECELSLCRDIQRAVLETVFTVERLWALDFVSDVRLQQCSAMDEKPPGKTVFTNGLIDAVYEVRDDRSAKFLYIKESHMNEMTASDLHLEGFRHRQDIADSYAELHKGWETVYQSGDTYLRFYRCTDQRLMYVGPFILQNVERMKYERFMQQAALYESESTPGKTERSPLQTYIWANADLALQVARQREAHIYSVFEKKGLLLIRSGFWGYDASGYLLASRPVEIGGSLQIFLEEPAAEVRWIGGGQETELWRKLVETMRKRGREARTAR